ncbi:MAG: acyltransferase family protein [Planctomycetota bacterium]
MAAIAYRPDIDGLRAVAIVPVILFHLGVGWMPGGYLGVDVFFVISGFLITSILLREMAGGQFSLKRFWTRRIRRIVPNLAVVSAVTLLASWVIVFPPNRPAIGRQAAAALLSVANLYFWRFAGDYWGPQAEDSPFLHAWSLSVEEQFYLVFPLTLCAVVRWTPRWTVVALSMILTGSLCLFVFGVNRSPAATFYLLPTRAWELAAGALVAAASCGRPEVSNSTRAEAAFAWCGLGGILATYFLLPTLSSWVVVPVAGAALLIWCESDGLLKSVLSHPALTYIGKLSYSLYLWHWPVLVLCRQAGYDAHPIVLVLLIAALSTASYYLVEEPFRRSDAAVPRIAVGFVGGLLAAAFTAVAVPASLNVSGFDLQSYSLYYNIHPHYEQPADRLEVLEKLRIPESAAITSAYLKDGVVVGLGDGPPRVVVLGDSHGCFWAHSIRTACENAGLKVALYCTLGVRPFLDVPPSPNQRCHKLSAKEKYDYDLARITNIEIWKPEIVFVCARWSIVKPSDATGLLGFLQSHVKRVVLVEQPPELARVGTSNMAEVAVFRGISPMVDVRQYWPQGNVRKFQDGCRLIRSLAAEFPTCEVMPTADLFLENGRVFFLDGATLLYKDDNHLTTAGTAVAAPRIRDVLDR